jgi:hypothetical protein
MPACVTEALRTLGCLHLACTCSPPSAPSSADSDLHHPELLHVQLLATAFFIYIFSTLYPPLAAICRAIPAVLQAAFKVRGGA